MGNIRPKELAEKLGISKSYIYLLIRFGEIPVKRDAGYLVISEDIATRLIEKWRGRGTNGIKDKRFKLFRKAA